LLSANLCSKLFFAIAICIRFIQGIGDSLVSTAGKLTLTDFQAYSIISIEFPGEREKYIGFCQTAVGLGLLSGPFIGQTIFIGAGYAGTFYAMAGILCVALALVSFLIPNRINEFGAQLPDEIILEQPKESRPSVQAMPIHKIAERVSFNAVALARQSARYSRTSKVLEAQVTYKIFLTNMRAMTAIISSMFAMIFMLFYEPVLSSYLKNQYDQSDNVVGNNKTH
jgi:MFS family permease